MHPKHFPADHTLGNKSVLAAAEEGLDAMAYAGKLMHGIWCDDANVADPDYIRATAAAVGIDGDALIASAEGDAIGARYQELTEEEPFWGQDRLEFVRDTLLGGVETLAEIE